LTRATDWHVLDLSADPVPGDPWRVKDLGGRLRNLADDAENAARNVRGLVGDHAAMNWIGAAGDAFKEHIGKFPGQLDKVANSHHMCADALLAYANDLDTAQSQADRALVQARPLFDQVQSLHSQLASANATATSATKSYSTLTNGANAPDSTALAAAVRAKTDSQHTVDTLNSQLSGPEAQLAALRNLAHQAAGLRESAENTAERQIHAATDAGIPPDSFWHKLGDLAATLWHGLVIIAKIVSFIGAIVLLVVGGPLWLIVAVVVAGLIILADTLYKYSQGQASLWDVGLAVLGCIPITKGLTSLNAIREAFQAGGLLGAGLHVGGALLSPFKSLAGGMVNLLRNGGGLLRDSAEFLQTGGSVVRRARSGIDFMSEWGDIAYDAIRADPQLDKVAATAAEHGFSAADIQQIFKHVFVDEHELDMFGENLVARFDANPHMAEAWMRLQDGIPHAADIDLLRHELTESTWMATHGSQSYSAAHQAAIDAGHTWDEQAAARDGLGYGARYGL
jgi:hypothetical protein